MGALYQPTLLCFLLCSLLRIGGGKHLVKIYLRDFVPGFGNKERAVVRWPKIGKGFKCVETLARQWSCWSESKRVNAFYNSFWLMKCQPYGYLNIKGGSRERVVILNASCICAINILLTSQFWQKYEYCCMVGCVQCNTSQKRRRHQRLPGN